MPLPEHLYKINVTITAFIDVVDIDDMSARVMACEQLRDKVDGRFNYDVIETEVFDVEDMPR